MIDRKSIHNKLSFYRTIVFTKYEDIKKVFDLEEASGRPSSAPGNKTRPGWHTVAKFDPENVDRPPGVLFCQVSLHKIPLVYSRVYCTLTLYYFLGKILEGAKAISFTKPQRFWIW